MGVAAAASDAHSDAALDVSVLSDCRAVSCSLGKRLLVTCVFLKNITILLVLAVSFKICGKRAMAHESVDWFASVHRTVHCDVTVHSGCVRVPPSSLRYGQLLALGQVGRRYRRGGKAQRIFMENAMPDILSRRRFAAKLPVRFVLLRRLAGSSPIRREGRPRWSSVPPRKVLPLVSRST